MNQKEIRFDPVTGWSNIPWESYALNCPVCSGSEVEEKFSIRRDSSFIRVIKESEEGWDVKVIKRPVPLVDDEFEGEYSDWPFKGEPAKGAHYVIVLGKKHVPFHEVDKDTLMEGLFALQELYKALSEVKRLKYVHVMVLDSNGQDLGGHPHIDVIGLTFVPSIIEEQLNGFKEAYEEKSMCPMCEVLKSVESGNRLVHRDRAFIGFVPWSPNAPHELLLAASSHFLAFQRLGQKELSDLAFALKVLGASMHRLYSGSYAVQFVLPPPKRTSSYFHFYVRMFTTGSVQDSLERSISLNTEDSKSTYKKITEVYKEVLKEMVGL